MHGYYDSHVSVVGVHIRPSFVVGLVFVVLGVLLDYSHILRMSGSVEDPWPCRHHEYELDDIEMILLPSLNRQMIWIYGVSFHLILKNVSSPCVFFCDVCLRHYNNVDHPLVWSVCVYVSWMIC